VVHVQDDRDRGGTHGGDGEVDEEGRVVERPGEEEDLSGRTLFFGGADDGCDGFEVVLNRDC
jgi:hypothetical protein